jgi:ABC-type transporter Mla subunit MlaD
VTLAARILAHLAALALAAAGGWFAAMSHRDGKEAIEAAAASEANRETERLMAKSRTRIDDEHNQSLRAVNDRLADALERLRDRPDRLPEAARAACQGATGRELSGPDAAVLERYAADARRLQLALGACQDREWDAFEKMNGRR